MVSIDFSINSARQLLQFEALRPVDARIIGQSEMLAILGPSFSDLALRHSC